LTHRVALCIGISSYLGEGISRLPNAASDAQLVHRSLTARGFDSECIINATYNDIAAALQRLQAKGKAEPTLSAFTVIYFAGHGFETSGLGFLLPVDFPGPVNLVRIPNFGLSTLLLVNAISGNAGPKLIILDACRSDAAQESTVSELARFNELAEDIKAQYPDVVNADDVVFAFATSAGAPAGDGVNGHSRYCEALASGLLSHDHSLDELLASVAQQVIRSSKMGQRPWYLSSLTHPLCFSDMPTFIPIPFEVYRSKYHQEVTRTHPLNASRFAYSIGDELLIAQGYERRPLGKFAEPIQAIGTFGSDLYVLLESGFLMHGNIDSSGEVEFTLVYTTTFTNVFAMSVSPNGCTIVIVDVAGYEVINRVGEEWSQRAKCETPGFSFYNVKFLDDDSAVLCGGSGMVHEVTGLNSLDIELESQDAQIEISSPIHDIEIVDGGKLVVTVSGDGYVNFFARSTWELSDTVSINGAALNIAHGYASLRDQFTRERVELYFRDKAAFAAQFPEEPGILKYVDKKVGHQCLLCCSLMQDIRVLAVASEEGFVFLIDVRDRKHFRTIDVGGGLGKSLRWMCADLDSNAFIVLLNDGTMVRYEGLMPQY